MMRTINHSQRPSNGLTLPELLIAIAIGSIVLLAASEILTSHIRSSSRMEAIMRLQDSWSRLQFLLNHEIQEARGASVDSSGALILNIPDSTNPATLSTISYRTAGTALQRFGPTIGSDGSLIFNQASTTQVVLRGVSAFTPSLGNGGSQQVRFTVSLVDPTGVTLTQRGSATTADARIIN